jgi:hypothetical protein
MQKLSNGVRIWGKMPRVFGGDWLLLKNLGSMIIYKGQDFTTF